MIILHNISLSCWFFCWRIEYMVCGKPINKVFTPDFSLIFILFEYTASKYEWNRKSNPTSQTSSQLLNPNNLIHYLTVHAFCPILIFLAIIRSGFFSLTKVIIIIEGKSWGRYLKKWPYYITAKSRKKIHVFILLLLIYAQNSFSTPS